MMNSSGGRNELHSIALATLTTLIVAGCAACRSQRDAFGAAATPSGGQTIGNHSSKPAPVDVFAKRPYAIDSTSVPECIVKGQPRPEFVRPVVEFVASSLTDELPSNWDAGYDVFVVDAAEEWPEYALGNGAKPPFPESHRTVRVRGRPSVGIDVRSQTGMLSVTGPDLASRFYCIHLVHDGKTRIGLDLFMRFSGD